MSQVKETSLIATYVRGLWQKSELSDLTLQLSDSSELKVHKLVVFQCDFFRAACSGEFKEACENIIKFPEDDPIAMKALVKHLYGYTTIEVLTGDGKVGISVQWLLGLHDIAQKYTQPQLAASTLSEFERLCSMADSGTHLKQQANWWEHMAKDIYNKASDYDRTLWRQALLRLTWIHSKILIQNEDLIKAVTRDVPGFAAELFLRGGLDGKGIKKA